MSGLVMGVFNFFAEPIKKYVINHLCYIVQVEDNVKALKRNGGILEAKRKDVEERIQREEATLMKRTNEVDVWLNRTHDLQPTTSSQQIEDDYKRRSCMLGSCSLNCFSNHSIGLRAVEVLNNIREELAAIDIVKEYTTEASPPMVQGMNATTIQFGREMFESQLNQALEFLRDGNIIKEKKGMFGIWGMGGVGKTTLLEHINDAMEKSPLLFGFDKVVFVTASKDCKDANMLLKLIIRELGLPAEKSGKRDVFNYLKNKSFAVLLDDLWFHMDLKEAGIPLPLGVVANNCKRKLILTSRSHSVCCRMGVDQFINVQCLPPDDARRLFHANADLDDVMARSDPQLLKHANEAADECDGLPIALIATGRAMRGKEDVRVWRNAVRLLRNSKLSQITGVDDPLPLLKVSYDHLEVRERECLLHCALWPEDHRINKQELIKCWMGHGLLGEYSTIEEACDVGHTIIDSLQKACLLESAMVDWRELRNQHVKLHDVIRDMALWIARECGANEKKWMVLSGDNATDVLRDINTLKEVHKMSVFSDLKIPGLQSLARDSCCSTTTFVSPGAKFLVVPSILGCLQGLKYLDLSNCRFDQLLPIEICGLEKLEYLNLRGTGIESLPEELKNLTNLKFLRCRNTDITEIPVDLLLSLVNLFELDLFTDYTKCDQGSIIDQLVHSSLEGGRLKALGICASSASDLRKITRLSHNGVSIRALKIDIAYDPEISNSLDLLSGNSFGCQAMYSNMEELMIGKYSGRKVVMEGEYRLLNLESFLISYAKSLEEIIWKGVEPTAVFPRLRHIKIFDCRLKHATWAANLPCLEILEIYACSEMEQLVLWDGKEDNSPRISFFPTLRTIRLNGMPKLTRLSNAELSFGSLEYLITFGCPKLESLPFNSPASCSKLRSIEGRIDWWEALQLEGNMRSFLQPFCTLY